MRIARSRKPDYKHADNKSLLAHLFIKTALIGAIAGCALMPDKPNAAKAEPFRAAMSQTKHHGKAARPHKPRQAEMRTGGYAAVGNASWYGAQFQGRRTASGEVFNMRNLTAAHKTLPLPSYARVTNLRNGASLIVRVNDRGPYAHNRLIDLSQRAAQLLGYHSGGLAKVKVEYLGRAPKAAGDEAYLRASYKSSAAQPAAAQSAEAEKPRPAKHRGRSAVSFPR